MPSSDERMEHIMITNVTVLIPPAVEPVEPPIIIRIIVNAIEESVRDA